MTMLSRRALRHCARSAWTPARLSKIFHPSGQSKRLRRASSLFPPIHPNALFTKHSWSALNRNKSANKEVLMQLWPREKHGSQMMNAHAAARSGLYADRRAEQILDLPPDQRMREILKMPPEDQRALATSLKGDKRDEFLEGMDPKQRETLMALNNPQQVVLDELVQAKLLRAIYSERQLQEVMTDFWFNHFNVFIGKGADRYLLTSYERDVIRPHAMGKFEDLLVATAQSPAMLFYLDNWLSVGPNSEIANGIPKRDRSRRRF